MITDRPAFLKVSGLTYRIGGSVILDDVSFEVPCGDYVGLIGPNGSGKTTLLRVILGLVSPDQGSVVIHGQAEDLPAQRARIGYVPQRTATDYRRFPASVWEVVATGCTQRRDGPARSERARMVREALERLGIMDLSDRLIADLSGGERQKVYIARALAAGATALVLDEPTVGIDAPSTEAFYRLLAALNREGGMTIILVSHDIDVVAREAKSVLCINHRLVCHGTPREALSEEYVRLLYGDEMRFVYHDRHDHPPSH